MTSKKKYSKTIRFGLLLGIDLVLMGVGVADVSAEDAVSSGNGSTTVVALKTNLLYDALLSPNIGAEIGLSPKFTFDVSGNLNLWNLSGNSWKHWQLQPELRYWLCQRFSGHFIGIETHVGQFNVGNIDFSFDFLGTDFGKLKNRRYQGWQGGFGVTYGY